VDLKVLKVSKVLMETSVEQLLTILLIPQQRMLTLDRGI
jgi:hypothetical protein